MFYGFHKRERWCVHVIFDGPLPPVPPCYQMLYDYSHSEITAYIGYRSKEMQINDNHQFTELEQSKVRTEFPGYEQFVFLFYELYAGHGGHLSELSAP